MNVKDLKQLAGLLKQFREEQDADGAKSIEAAPNPQSAANRERFISEQLRRVDFVRRWVDAKIRAVEPPQPETKDGKAD